MSMLKFYYFRKARGLGAKIRKNRQLCSATLANLFISRRALLHRKCGELDYPHEAGNDEVGDQAMTR